MKVSLVIISLTAIILLAGSCSKDPLVNDSQKGYLALDKGNYNFLKSEQLFNEVKLNRSDGYSGSFEIVKVERIREILNITVSFIRGCEVNKFDVVWDGLIMESYPEMLRLLIKRSSACNITSGETISIVLSINLADCIGDKALAERATIIISNASKSANTDNADIAVSNKN